MSSDDAKLIASLVNVVALGFLIAANVGASRDGNERNHVAGSRQFYRGYTSRGRVLLTMAIACLGVGIALFVYGLITG